MTTNKAACKDCVFYDPIDNDPYSKYARTGYCVRHPPVVMISPQSVGTTSGRLGSPKEQYIIGGNAVTLFPQVRADQRCGEFKPKGKGESNDTNAL